MGTLRLTKRAMEEFRLEALDVLRHNLAQLEVEPRVYTITTHIARSGAQINIRCYMMLSPDHAHGEHGWRPWQISILAARVLGYRYDDTLYGGVVVKGGGMDMEAHLVECLSRALGTKLEHRRL